MPTRGERLHAARAERRTLDDVVADYNSRFGKQRGVSRATWARWENDQAWPDPMTLDNVCQVLEVNMAEIDPDSVAKVLTLAGRYRPSVPGGDESGEEAKGPESAGVILRDAA